MKIVLTDAQTVVDNLVNADPLRELGEVQEFGLLAYDDIAERIADADVVVVNKTLLDSHTLRLAKNLKYIGLFATGYNNIDIACFRRLTASIASLQTNKPNPLRKRIVQSFQKTV